MASVSLLDAHTDLHELIGERPSAKLARELYPDYPRGLPRFLPQEWLKPLRLAVR